MWLFSLMTCQLVYANVLAATAVKTGTAVPQRCFRTKQEDGHIYHLIRNMKLRLLSTLAL